MIKILLFGVLTERTGVKEYLLEGNRSLNTIIEEIFSLYPNLKESKFRISVNKFFVTDYSVIVPVNSEVALLPPFSGG